MAAGKIDEHTHNTGSTSFSGADWVAMNFTASESYTITSVKLNLFKTGTPGTLTVSIRNTTADVPSGGDLASGTFNANDLLASPGQYEEITLGAGYSLVSGTKYAIVCRCVAASVYWGRGLTYPGGGRCTSANAGVNWGAESVVKMNFETWGTPSSSIPSDQVVVRRLVAAGNNKFYYEDL